MMLPNKLLQPTRAARPHDGTGGAQSSSRG